MLQNLANLFSAREWLIIVTAFVAGMITMLVLVCVDTYKAKRSK